MCVCVVCGVCVYVCGKFTSRAVKFAYCEFIAKEVQRAWEQFCVYYHHGNKIHKATVTWICRAEAYCVTWDGNSIFVSEFAIHSERSVASSFQFQCLLFSLQQPRRCFCPLLPVLVRRWERRSKQVSNVLSPVNAAISPICHLLALLGAHHILHVSRIRVKDKRKYMNLH